MADFPSSLKSFTTKVDNVTDVLAAHVNDLQGEVAALEAKVGVDSSAVSTSLDYIIKNTSSGHRHDGSDSRKVKVTDLDVAGLTTSQLLRTNSGGTAVESSGKVVPAGTIVGTSDSQSLTNKSLDNTNTFTAVPYVTPPANIAQPTGAITMWTTASAPTGWLLCDGSSLLRASYTDLFGVIGTTFGSADGTHFTLPDFRDRFPIGKSGTKSLASTGGAETVNLQHSHTAATGSTTLSTSQIPAHSHGVTDPGHSHELYAQAWSSVTGGARAFPELTGSPISPNPIIGTTTGISIQNTGGGAGHTHTISNDGSTTQSVLNPYLAINFIIKT